MANQIRLEAVPLLVVILIGAHVLALIHFMAKRRCCQEDEEGSERDSGAEEPKVVALPKRRVEINYKIYGLDLSDSKWSQVADKIHEAEKIIWPQEPKRIDGKCKIITDKILSSQEKDDSFTLSRMVNVLGEESFETNIRDYSKLIDAHARDNRLEDAKRIIKKMSENEIVLDILTSTTMVHMYSKAGDLDRANAAFESLRTQGFLPDMGVYNSMILAYVNAGDPKKGESLMREMEARDIKPSKEIFMALLRSFVQHGDVNGAQRIATKMHRQDVVEAQQRWPFLSQQCLQKRSPGDGRETKTPLELFLEGGYPYKSEMLHLASDKESLSNTGSTSEEG
ncbi:hypothetical protein KY290_035543 [Solanum tuberosum]|uniref:PROP1-like PPR domain-containing protein n=1 Tax=Solanum tuberosum TaxID=4113 RepID=A0ABQ7U6R1_SOLTU|nr:hypothetical protein KY289_033604 [Solanum tuberosum]KAH0742500.1 hypothetical protein KY290_035543 [Solanum tuberosum]